MLASIPTRRRKIPRHVTTNRHNIRRVGGQATATRSQTVTIAGSTYRVEFLDTCDIFLLAQVQGFLQTSSVQIVQLFQAAFNLADCDHITIAPSN